METQNNYNKEMERLKLLGYNPIDTKAILTAEEILNETETEPFTIEERTDLNINKVTHDKVRRANK